MFPLFSSTYSFRLYHLQHHQFINDPERDPDFAMLKRSGHWLGFPVARRKFLLKLLSQVLLIDLLRYAVVRFRYNALPSSAESPSQSKTTGTKVPLRLSLGYVLTLCVSLIILYHVGNLWGLLTVVAIGWGLVTTILCSLGDRHYELSRIRPVYARRYLASSRMAFITLLFTGLTCGQLVTGWPLWWYFVVFWVVPLLTTFQFCMVLRQLVQHGNCDRSFIGNTRVFLVNPLLRYAVFPFGMDYHTPHHMYATVPHYRLPALHAYLLRFPEYQQECTLVKNYLIPSGHVSEELSAQLPTIVDVLGPEYAVESGGEIWIDSTVLDNWEVEGQGKLAEAASESNPDNSSQTSLHQEP